MRKRGFVNSMKRPYLSSPTRVCLFLTQRCNFKCKYCYVNAGSGIPKDELSLREIKDIFDQLQECNILRLRLYGGEPLMRKDIFEILDLLGTYHFSKQINTNGYFITDTIAKGLREAKVGWAIVSLDGPKEFHEELCGVKDSFEKIISGIRTLKEQNIRVGLDYVLTSFNLNCFYETLDIAAELEVDVFRILPLSLVGRANEKMKMAALSYDQWSKFYVELTRMKTHDRLTFSNVVIADSDCNVCTWNRYYPLPANNRKTLLQTAWNIDLDSIENEAKGLHCIGGISLCTILANGDVIPCDQMLGIEALRAGNIRKNKLQDIWNHSHVFGMLRNITKRDLHGPCGVCDNSYCSGLNMGAAFHATGDFLGSDLNCIKAKALTS